MSKQQRAIALSAKAHKLHEAGQIDEAIALYHKVIALAPQWGTPLYNLGLLYKNQRKWAESLEYNQRATEVEPENDAAWWNLGIAATALGRWETARAAWRGFGIDVPDGDGPIDLPCGYGPFRLHPDGEAEVVWGYRIDPARAQIANIPFPESGFRWRDVVLNDGAPMGYRKVGGRDFPVLNVLELLSPSPFGTFVAHVKMPGQQEYIAELGEIAAEMGGSAEDWTTSVRILCRACSEGRPHDTHDTEDAPPDGVHLIGIATRDREHASEILLAWESGKDDVEVDSLDDMLEPGPADR